MNSNEGKQLKSLIEKLSLKHFEVYFFFLAIFTILVNLPSTNRGIASQKSHKSDEKAVKPVQKPKVQHKREKLSGV